MEAARGGGADELPLAPFPPRPDTPPSVIAAGDEEEEEPEAENKGDEEAYGPGESVLALMYQDDAGPAAMGIVTQWAIRLLTSDFYGPSPPTPNTQAPHDRLPPPPPISD